MRHLQELPMTKAETLSAILKNDILSIKQHPLVHIDAS
jgi:hypothetical protein